MNKRYRKEEQEYTRMLSDEYLDKKKTQKIWIKKENCKERCRLSGYCSILKYINCMNKCFDISFDQ